MKIIQRTGILFLLLVFLFGTTGLSVFHHVCNSSNEDNVSAYTGIFRGSGPSCCDDESTGYSCARPENLTGDAMPQNISAPPCCKSTISFLRLEIVTVRAEKLLLNVDKSLLTNFPLFLSLESMPDQPLLKPAHFQFYSPPLISGKALVHYLHRIKIPDLPSFAC
ncbi:MAG: hypothetical protein NTW16_06965 [Bacteroidetes bacterium]|nr:hypothetical protein [Bacteroidota bacterium]